MAWGSFLGGAAGAAGANIANSLFGKNSAPPNVNTSGTQTTQLPSWYTQYIQGAINNAAQLASQPFPQYTGQRLAGFNDTQQSAFNAINNAQGNWSPLLTAGLNTTGTAPGYANAAANTAYGYGGNAAGLAGGAYGGALGAGSLANQYGSGAYGSALGAASNAGGYGAGALGAASNPVQWWNNPATQQNWMSPYMSNVVNAIQNQGNTNWATNIMPNIEAQFIGNGNANSAANAGALGVGAALNNANINANVANALQAGYGTSLQGFLGNQAQQLQQQGLAAQTGLGAGNLALGGGQLGVQGGLAGANTALGGGSLGLQGGLGAASTNLSAGQLGLGAGGLGLQGALGAASQYYGAAPQLQTMGYNDIAQLLAAGNQQQQLEQLGYNTAYGNFQNQVQWPMQQMSFLSGIANGAQLPTSTNATGNAPLAGAMYGPSPLQLGYYGAAEFGPSITSGLNSLGNWYNNYQSNQAQSGNPNSSYENPPGVKTGGLFRASARRPRRDTREPPRSPLAAARHEEF